VNRVGYDNAVGAQELPKQGALALLPEIVFLNAHMIIVTDAGETALARSEGVIMKMHVIDLYAIDTLRSLFRLLQQTSREPLSSSTAQDSQDTCHAVPLSNA
jgi:hypothetical protein